MMTRTDMELLLFQLEAHYCLLKARVCCKMHPALSNEEFKLMLGATIELSCQHLYPAMKEAGLLDPKYFFSINSVAAVKKLVYSTLVVDLDEDDIDEAETEEDEHYEKDYSVIYISKLMAGLQFEPTRVRRRDYLEKLREKLAELHPTEEKEEGEAASEATGRA